MKNLVILHGKPTREKYEDPNIPNPDQANWLPWLGRKVTERGISVSIPALPRPYFPVYENWKGLFDLEDVSSSTGLVGHSTGAEFILRWLSENRDAELERVVLVAPWRDEAGKYGSFSRYYLDEGITDRVGRLTVFSSIDDSPAIQARAQALIGLLPGTFFVELDGFGHFMLGNNMSSEEFPELFEELMAR